MAVVGMVKVRRVVEWMPRVTGRMHPHRVEVLWKRRLDASVTRHVEKKSRAGGDQWSLSIEHSTLDIP